MAKNVHKRNFLRVVYQNGATPAARESYLNTLLAEASQAVSSGTALTGSSGAGVTVQFEQLRGTDPLVIQELVDWAFDHIEAADIATALAGTPRRGVTAYRTSFAGIRQ